MRRQDAQDILRMIESLWAIDLGTATRDVWRPAIEEYEDAALVTEAIIDLGKREVYRPSLALIGQAVAKRQKDRGVVERPTAPPRELPWVKSEIPHWVKRWFYARFRAVPPDRRHFREQWPDGGKPDDYDWMPEGEYVKEAEEVVADDVAGVFQAGRQM